nr:hypothetical protein [Kofleriaceae bacterium]
MPGVAMISPSGEPVTIDESGLAAAMNAGYKVEKTADAVARTTREGELANYSGAANTIKAGVMAGLRTASLGATDVMYGDAEDLKNLREAHPTADTLGTLAGFAATIPAAGATSTIARYTPAGMVARRAAQIAEVGEGATAAAKVAAIAKAGAYEGAINSAGSYISDVALEDKDLSAEGFLGSLGHGAMWGGAAGGVIGGLERGSVAARRLFPRSAVGDAGAVEVAEKAAAQTLDQAASVGPKLVQSAKARIEELAVTKAQISTSAAAQREALRSAQSAQRLETQKALDAIRVEKAAARGSKSGAAEHFAGADDTLAREAGHADVEAAAAHASVDAETAAAHAAHDADIGRIQSMADDVAAKESEVRAMLAEAQPATSAGDPFRLPASPRQDLAQAYDDAIGKLSSGATRAESEAALEAAAQAERAIFDDALSAGGSRMKQAQEILDARAEAGIDHAYAAARRMEKVGTASHVPAVAEVERGMAKLGPARPPTLEELLQGTKAQLDRGATIGEVGAMAKGRGRFTGDAAKAVKVIGDYEKSVATLARELGDKAPAEAQAMGRAYDAAVEKAASKQTRNAAAAIDDAAATPMPTRMTKDEIALRNDAIGVSDDEITSMSAMTSRADRDALYEYSGDAASRINADLRAGRVPQEAKSIDAAISSPIDRDVVVFRGLKGARFSDRLSVGDEIADRAYMSTSAIMEGAEGFSAGGGVLRIHVPKGTKMGAVADSAMDHERELLLPRNVKLRVSKISEVDGVPVVDARVVSTAAETDHGRAYARMRDVLWDSSKSERKLRSWVRDRPESAVADLEKKFSNRMSDGEIAAWKDRARVRDEASAIKAGRRAEYSAETPDLETGTGHFTSKTTVSVDAEGKAIDWTALSPAERTAKRLEVEHAQALGQMNRKTIMDAVLDGKQTVADIERLSGRKLSADELIDMSREQNLGLIDDVKEARLREIMGERVIEPAATAEAAIADAAPAAPSPAAAEGPPVADVAKEAANQATAPGQGAQPIRAAVNENAARAAHGEQKAMADYGTAPASALAKTTAVPTMAEKAAGKFGKVADVAAALEAARALGIPGIPNPNDIPVVGPLLGMYLKARAARAVWSRMGGRIPESVEARIATRSAELRDRAAHAVDVALGLTAKGAAKVRGVASASAPKAGDAIMHALYPSPDGKRAATPANVREAAAMRATELAAATSNPDALKAAVRAQIPTSDADLSDSIQAAITRKLQYLQKAAPPIPPPDPMNRKPPPVSTAAATAFARIVRVAEDPVSALHDLSAGTLTSDQADALKTIYPRLY